MQPRSAASVVRSTSSRCAEIARTYGAQPPSLCRGDGATGPRAAATDSRLACGPEAERTAHLPARRDEQRGNDAEEQPQPEVVADRDEEGGRQQADLTDEHALGGRLQVAASGDLEAARRAPRGE